MVRDQVSRKALVADGRRRMAAPGTGADVYRGRSPCEDSWGRRPRPRRAAHHHAESSRIAPMLCAWRGAGRTRLADA
eukprot:882053-Alexandrium_andersonii.AAC.1